MEKKRSRMLLELMMLMMTVIISLPSTSSQSRSGSIQIQLQIDEELPVDSLVANLKSMPSVTEGLSSEDLNRATFAIDGGDDDADKYFRMDNDGVIKIKKTINREQICSNEVVCQKTLIVKFEANFQIIITLTININDVNDNRPIFPVTSKNLTLYELTLVGTIYGLDSAKDSDSPKYGIKEYTIVPIPGSETSAIAASKFTVYSSNDKLYLKVIDNLDQNLEPDESYSFNVIAVDKGEPPLEGTLLVNIRIIDENNHSPIFTSSSYRGSVSEDASLGTSVLSVTATDADKGLNAEITYRIIEDDSVNKSPFSIDPRTGTISLASATLDRENISKYELTVEAKDSGALSKSSNTEVLISVLDVNDNDPQISIDLKNKLAAEIWEDSTPGTEVFHVIASDSDDGPNGLVTCRLKEGKEYFSIFDLQGYSDVGKSITFQGRKRFRVVSSVRLDSEVSRSLNVTINCSDQPLNGNARTAEVIVPIKILDINDNSPIFEKNLYEAKIKENEPVNTFVIKVSASDLDDGANGHVTYSFPQSSTYDYFAIDQLTGIITAKVSFDREKTPFFDFQVEAKDRGNPSRNGLTNARVTILDLNDNDPIFSRTSYQFLVLDGLRANTTIGYVQASDADEGANADIEYNTIKEDGKCSEIVVDTKSGTLSPKISLSAKRCKIHNLKVEARNPGNRSSIIDVAVYVKEAGDESPVFKFPSIENNTITVKYPIDSSLEIAKISATAVFNVDYMLETIVSAENSNNISSSRLQCINKLFSLEKKSGNLFVDVDCLETLDVKHNSTFQLLISAADYMMPPLKTEARLNVVFTDLPQSNADFPSVFSSLSLKPTFVVILAIVASTVLVILILSTIIACVVVKTRRTKDKIATAKHKYQICCKNTDEGKQTANSPTHDVLVENNNWTRRTDQVIPAHVQTTTNNKHQQLQHHQQQQQQKNSHSSSSSASTLCGRNSESPDSGKGASDQDLQALRRREEEEAAKNQMRSSNELVHSDLSIHHTGPLHPNSFIDNSNFVDVNQQHNFQHYNQPFHVWQQPPPHPTPIQGVKYFDVSHPPPYAGHSRADLTTTNVPFKASMEDFDVDAGVEMPSKFGRVLGRRDLKRNSLIVPSKKQHQLGVAVNEDKTKNLSQNHLNNQNSNYKSSVSSLGASQIYNPINNTKGTYAGINRNNFHPSQNFSPRSSQPPPYSIVSMARSPKHVTFNEAVAVSRGDSSVSDLRDSYFPVYSAGVTKVSSSSGFYNLSTADPNHHRTSNDSVLV